MAECVKAHPRPAVITAQLGLNDIRQRAWECAFVLQDHDLPTHARILIETTLIGGPERVPVTDAGELFITAIKTLGARQ